MTLPCYSCWRNIWTAPKHFLQDAGKAFAERWTLHLSNLAYTSAARRHCVLLTKVGPPLNQSHVTRLIQLFPTSYKLRPGTCADCSTLPLALLISCPLGFKWSAFWWIFSSTVGPRGLLSCVLGLWTEPPLSMAAAGAGLGRTLDDHEEITDHVF